MKRVLEMDAFESVISMLLRREGYWTIPNFKVELTKEEKREIGKFSSPRWELDLVGYQGLTNTVLVVECKSFLDSPGVMFRGGTFEPIDRYKLFVDDALRCVVLNRLGQQLEKSKACRSAPIVQLCLAAGRIASQTDRQHLKDHFGKQNWQLFDPDWIKERLRKTSQSGYENDIAFVVSKLLLRD